MSKVTWAILWTGTGSTPDDPFYITTPEDPNAQGYAYCCGCKETLQFANEAAARTYMTGQGINPKTHTPTDSVTAKAAKAKRKPVCSSSSLPPVPPPPALSPPLPKPPLRKPLRGGWE